MAAGGWLWDIQDAMTVGDGMRRICVFAGSSPGARPAYETAATELGRLLATRGIGVVYGGGHVGLMGTVADAALAAGAEVIGVIPETLMQREVGHGSLTELRVVHTMHERKALMNELADGFIALPGGLGTLEELCEVLTWAQLGIHRKPVGALDVDGFWVPFTRFLDHAVTQRFVHPHHRELLVVGRTPQEVLERMGTWRAPTDIPKWMDREEI